MKLILFAALGLLGATLPASAGATDRAARTVALMTLDEKISLLHGIWAAPIKGVMPPAAAVGGAGYVPGLPRLHIPALQETDAGLGIANPDNVRPHDQATALPSGLALAASFDPGLNRQAGAMVGRDAAARGFNVLLGGGGDLIRDPRGGRSFEYLSEDPLLTGRLAGAQIAGVQSSPVIATLKHFAMNDQESGVFDMTARIGERAMRESDLLAFEIALEQGRPGAVMCAYNLVNGTPACQDAFLLNDVLKHDWHYRGFVMSDWGAVHSTVPAALAGLDQESGEQFDRQVFFGAPLKQAVLAGRLTPSRIDDMATRILRSMFAHHVTDPTPRAAAADVVRSELALARTVAVRGAVLLRDQAGLLPLTPGPQRIVLIGGHADQGVITGGGSPQVTAVGGLMQTDDPPRDYPGPVFFDRSAPLAALRDADPGARIGYDDGRDPARAARAARAADVAIVFATQWSVEGLDQTSLSLPDHQDGLIEAVAQANPHTVVVLETGDPVSMPWLDRVGAVLEAWYPGNAGGPAIADLLTGRADPSGRLPVTFPRDVAQLPRPVIPGQDSHPPAPLTGIPASAPFDVDYAIEGADVGYRWFSRQRIAPLFPFGFGLSYTRFALSGLRLAGRGVQRSAEFDLRNTGARPGRDTPQLYADLPDGSGHMARRLLGWASGVLSPGRSTHLRIAIDPRLLARYDVASHRWRIDPGRVTMLLAEDAADPLLQADTVLAAATLPP